MNNDLIIVTFCLRSIKVTSGNVMKINYVTVLMCVKCLIFILIFVLVTQYNAITSKLL